MIKSIPEIVNQTPVLKNEVVHQKLLEAVVKQIFPGEEVKSNARRESNFINRKTGHYFEVDVWLPSLLLGFEFQDDYHYMTTWYSHISLDAIKEKDIHKKYAVNTSGTTLIGVPNWWDVKRESLAASIKFERPEFEDICESADLPIPLNPPNEHFNISMIPEVGELMYASYPNSTIYVSDENPWWMGEKYDGIRSCWNSDRKRVYSRLGNEQNLLPRFMELLPDTYLDSEIWFGRGYFAESQKLVRGHNVGWPLLRLLAFDEPGPMNRNLPFEIRYEILVENITFDHPNLQLAPRLWCIKQKLLNASLENIINDGGEGVILRKPNSIYENGRSELLWKLKATRGDMEALVMKVEEDQSLLLQLPSGLTFTVPPQKSIHLTNTTKKGDIVTFTFDNFSNYSLPVNPVVNRVRVDTTWENVLRDFRSAKNGIPQSINEHSLVGEAKKKQPMNYWNDSNSENARNYLINFAKVKNMDPFLSSTWYSLSGELLRQQPARYIFRKYKSYVEGLMNIFPNIGLQPTKFTTVPPRYWLDVKVQREYFCQFAKNSKFDPLIAENWYNVSTLKFLLYKSARSIITRYDGNYAKTLLHVFPEIGLDKNKIPKVPNKFWYSKLYHKEITNLAFDESENVNQTLSEDSNNDHQISEDALLYLEQGITAQNREKWTKEENRRDFFINFANKKRLDPLIPTNWYSILPNEVLAEKDAKIVLGYYDGSVKKALFSLFPEIGLQKMKFREVSRNMADQETLRNFFNKIASNLKFDPLFVNKWYKNAKLIHKYKGAKTLLAPFSNKETKALQFAFPDLSWDSNLFKKPDSKYNSSDYQRSFFINYAKSKNFDPFVPENWYNVPIKELFRRQGGRSVLAQFQGSTVKALLHLFPDIGLNNLLFKNRVPNKHWSLPENRRLFFEQYAKENHFDPLSPESWYKVSVDHIMQSQKGISIMYLYKNRLPKALLHLFPEIGLDKNKIPKVMTIQLKDWIDKKNVIIQNDL